MSNSPSTQTSRRNFLKASASSAVGTLVASQVLLPPVAAGARAEDTLRIGLIGCGGRGTGAAAEVLQSVANVQLTVVADLFDDPLQLSLKNLQTLIPEKVDVPPSRQFLGFDAYRRAVASDVDIVLLTTPPGFRPQHLAAAIEAGKHAFVEITAAIDAPGVRSVLHSAELAEKNRIGILSGFCWRYNSAHRAVVEQIRQGAIGDIRALYSTYLRGDLTHKFHGQRADGMTDVEWQIRDWYNYSWLSGDVTILLSGGHSVDKMSWWLGDEMPIKAVATGSRVYPADGNTFDNGFVAYEYASGIRGFLACRSQPGCHNENADYIIGSQGVCTIGRGRTPFIQGEHEWRYTGPQNNMYQTELAEFVASIRAGRPINDGTRMARTTLMAIMGRMAAYTGQEITWDAALQSQESLMPENLDRNTKWDLPPTATPGLTKFL